VKWRRQARVGLAIVAVAFTVAVGLTYKRRTPPLPESVLAARTEPNAVAESTGGRLTRYKSTRQDVIVEWQKEVTYASGSTKLLGVTVTTQRGDGGRTFTITGKEGAVGQNQSEIKLDGDVRLTASDGLTAASEHVTYADAEGIVRAPGPVTFSRGRLSGSGTGLNYDKAHDTLTILNNAVVTQAPDAKGAGGLRIDAGGATIARADKYIRFERGVTIGRGTRTIQADNATASLTADERRIKTIDLHGGAQISDATTTQGGLRRIVARDMTLAYGADGESLERVTSIGDAAIEMGGAGDIPGRRIAAPMMDIRLAKDGATPTALTAREGVEATFPPDRPGGAARSVRSATLDATGEGGKGLNRARFADDVQFRERGAGVDRAASAEALDVALTPSTGAIQEARFSRSVRFEEGQMAADAASATYALAAGTLALGGSEPRAPVPHMVNDRMTIDAKDIQIALAGPHVKASGDVKSVLKPAKSGAPGNAGVTVPSMLKRDQPVNVTAAALDYDGARSLASYTGSAQLWQGDTSIKAASIAIDNKSGDLTANGPVTTTTMLEQSTKGKDTTRGKERTRSIATAKSFKYEEAPRRATYTGDAHMSGPQGDLTAARIELYLTASGDEIDHAEAFEKVTLREEGARKTTGDHLTYFGADERYVVTGAPVTIVDECGRETIGKTLTFFKATDRVVVDGNEQVRTQTKGGSTCK